MFQSAEIRSEVDKAAYEEAIPQLRVDLVNAQYDLREAPFPVLIVLVGDDRPGVRETVNRVNEWMDARYVATRVFGALTDEEARHPRQWRYWRALPARGELAIYTGPWALGTIGERLDGVIDAAEFDRRLLHMRRFEQTLVDEGGLVLKFWLHRPKQEVKRRIKKRKKANGNAGASMDPLDEALYGRYEEVMQLAEDLLRKTDSSQAPWNIVESTDSRHCNLSVARTILKGLEVRLKHAVEPHPEPPPTPSVEPAPLLDSIDLSLSIPRDEARVRRTAAQERIRQLTARAREQGLASVLVFEGMDAAGKGGVIRRIVQAMDVQDRVIVPVSAPSDEELRHHYLWRFWRRLPRAGLMAVFDRSWYGRVLVERVEGLASPAAVQRAYGEIDDFEEQLVEAGVLLLKFWLHIDRDEQARRFALREQTPYKKYKITRDDYRNRHRWDEYQRAVNEMLARTNPQHAPWHLVPANDKRHARIQVLETLCAALEERLGSAG